MDDDLTLKPTSFLKVFCQYAKLILDNPEIKKLYEIAKKEIKRRNKIDRDLQKKRSTNI